MLCSETLIVTGMAASASQFSRRIPDIAALVSVVLELDATAVKVNM